MQDIPASTKRTNLRLWFLLGAFTVGCAVPTSPLHAQSGVTLSNPQPVTTNPQALTPADQAPSQWPKRLALPQGILTVYQPQLTDFDDNLMKARAAVSLMRPNPGTDAATIPGGIPGEIPGEIPGDDQAIFGAIWLQCRVLTDRVARTVQITEVNVTRVRFPDLQGDDLQQQQLSDAMTQALRDNPIIFSLDQLLTMVETVKEDAQAVRSLETAPPRIIFANEPTLLVQYDGEPRLSQSIDSRLMQVVNTPYFVVLDSATKRYYLKGAGRWYIAREAAGPFLSIAAVPSYINELAVNLAYEDPQQEMADDSAATGVAPQVVTATEPTELIWTDGQEELSPIPGTSLLYVANTDADVFLDIQSQQTYVLLSGRWYAAPKRTGPWAYVDPRKLPADFARIPLNGPKGAVLAHVAGTQMARDAVADNFVPQTAAIDRQGYQQPAVVYDGSPRFEPVSDLGITYAVNSPNAVLYIGGRYYTCYNAVWYVSSIANGPWELCTVVPRQVYLIPPSCPIYPVRYVRIYEVTPTLIYTGYLPGYVGSYIHHGVVVYGTGYRYRPWYGQVYYPRPYTYGFSVRYDPYRSYWGFNIGINLGSGWSLWLGNTYRTNPVHSVWFGYGGYRPAYRPHHHRPYHRPAIVHRPGRPSMADRDWRRPLPRRDDFNLYERRRDVSRVTSTHRTNVTQVTINNGDDRRNRPGGDRDGRSWTRGDDRNPSPSRPNAGIDRRNDGRPDADRPTPSRDRGQAVGRNNIYADSQGNVYRRTDNGWERRDRNQWTPTRNAPSPASTDNRGRPGRASVNPTPDQARPSQPTVTPRPSQVEGAGDRPLDQPRAIRPGSREDTRNPASRRQGSIDRSNTQVPPANTPSRIEPDRSDRSINTPARRGSSVQGGAGATGRSSSGSLDAQPNPDTLNRDYRARILGQQRQQIYGRSSASESQFLSRPSTSSRESNRPSASDSSRSSQQQQPAASGSNERQQRASDRPSSGSNRSERSSGGSSRKGAGGGRGK